MKVGDLVKVETKLFGPKLGTIIDTWISEEASNRAWVVWIPNHLTSSTIVFESDMEIVQ